MKALAVETTLHIEPRGALLSRSLKRSTNSTRPFLRETAEPIDARGRSYIVVDDKGKPLFAISSYYSSFLEKIEKLSDFMFFLTKNFFN